MNLTIEGKRYKIENNLVYRFCARSQSSNKWQLIKSEKCPHELKKVLNRVN